MSVLSTVGCRLRILAIATVGYMEMYRCYRVGVGEVSNRKLIADIKYFETRTKHLLCGIKGGLFDWL